MCIISIKTSLDINKDASCSDAAVQDSAKIHEESDIIVGETSSVPILQTPIGINLYLSH